LQNRGFALLEDYMTDFGDGLGAVPTNCLLDRRVSASMAYLTQDVRRRKNLTIVPHARVDRLHVDGRRTRGVLVTHKGATRIVRGRQVIVSCGAIQSPALLMRSGIGPGERLSALGIPVIKDLPGVGANLQNHPSVAVTTYLPREAAQSADNPWLLQNWLRFSSRCAGCDPHDMHLMVFNKGAWHALGQRVGTIVVSVLAAYSKGRVDLSSADPAKDPNVRFNMLADSRDRDRLASGLRLVLELLTHTAVAKLRREVFFPDERVVASLDRRNSWNAFRARAITAILDQAPLRRSLLAASGIDPMKLLSNEQALLDVVHRHAGVQYHVCGTCRMGRAENVGTVVDGDGRVHGVDGLRVVDASIFPTIPRGYPHFIVLMLAEKLADAIKADWRGEQSGGPESTAGREASSVTA
jgi:5-(hydroxymethyl)furfural/furfural oxidase